MPLFWNRDRSQSNLEKFLQETRHHWLVQRVKLKSCDAACILHLHFISLFQNGNCKQGLATSKTAICSQNVRDFQGFSKFSELIW
jgi:hypothetical protein